MSSTPEKADIVAVGVRSIEPALLPLLEPRSLRIQEDPPACEKTGESPVDQDATPMLSVAKATFSRWYLELKDVISRGRVFQEKYREEHKLHKNSKAPWSNPGMTERNIGVAEGMNHVIRSVFGDGVAEYAMSSFVKATETGDLRSFKIRLLILKCRDSLKGSPFHKSFVAGVEKAISDAESSAGCLSYSGPRRMSRAEREKVSARGGSREKPSEPEKDDEAPGEPEADIVDALNAVVGNEFMEEASQDAMLTDELPAAEEAAPAAEPEPSEPTEPTDEDLRKVEEEAKDEERALESSECVDDDYLIEEMKAGRISPGKVWMMFDGHPPAKKAAPKKAKKTPKRLDIDQLARDVIAAETGNPDEMDEDEDAQDPDYEDMEDVEDEMTSTQGSEPSRTGDDDDDDDDDEDEEQGRRRRRRRRSYAELDFSDEGRVRRGASMYGSYNASGSEWDPYAD